MFRSLLLALLLLPATVGAKTIYKYYDADGNVVFTDEPVKGAEEVRLPEPQIVGGGSPAGAGTAPYDMSARPKPPASLPAMTGDLPNTLSPYSQFKIKSPTPDETFRNADDLFVTLSIMPRLRKGHKVLILLDGRPYGSPKPSPQFAIPDVERGTHIVEARVLDANGDMVTSSGAVTFHMQRNTTPTPAAAAAAAAATGANKVSLPTLPSATQMPKAQEMPKTHRGPKGGTKDTPR